MVDKKSTFLEKARKKHLEKYDYSKVEYVDSKTPVCIICPEHGEFMQTPQAHLRGQGCKECGKKKQGRHYTHSDYIERAIMVHGNKYDYHKAVADDCETYNIIICPEHGEFLQSWNAHINNKQGCPKCHGIGRTLEDIKHDLSVADGGKYECLETELKKLDDKWRFRCEKHGEFLQSATKHLRGQGCPACSGVKKHTNDTFISEAKLVHGDKYDYSKTEYTNNKTDVTITCHIHGDFEQSPFNHLHGHGCPKCVETTSNGEKELMDFLKTISDSEFETNNRNLIAPYEIDILCRDRKVGIEYDGIRWHTEKFCVNNYHLMKTEMCEKKGFRLIHIFEDEWMDKREIVESRLRSIFGATDNRIYARQCKISDVGYKDTKAFLDRNHIQGNCVSKYRYGLYNNNELVAIMTFGKPRKNMNGKECDGTYELIRFCNKLNTTVVGGASRLLKHFINEVKPNEIISYSDRRWSNGDMYERLGFSLDHISSPNYFYVVKGKRMNRFAFRKDILISYYGCPKYMPEHDFMASKGWYRIYDCGTKVWRMSLTGL